MRGGLNARSMCPRDILFADTRSRIQPLKSILFHFCVVPIFNSNPNR